MVSDVICISGYDRIFIFLSTFYMMGVMQVNIRAFYKKLHGVASETTNDLLLLLGIIACITLPLVGLVDENVAVLHRLYAGICFIAKSAYCIILSRLLYTNKKKLLKSERSEVTII